MRTPRRFLVLVALFFWQGGFTFYAAVVVPVGTDVLNSERRQGFITRRVTYYLNITGAVALAPLAWDVLAARDRRARRRWRAALWVLLALAQLALFGLHAYLDSLLQVRGRIVLDPEAFRPAHRTYLWVSTVQWGCGVLFLFLTLRAWQAAYGTLTWDSLPGEGESDGGEKSSAADSFGVAQSPRKPRGGTG
jgi:hypothetical protein